MCAGTSTSTAKGRVMAKLSEFEKAKRRLLGRNRPAAEQAPARPRAPGQLLRPVTEFDQAMADWQPPADVEIERRRRRSWSRPATTPSTSPTWPRSPATSTAGLRLRENLERATEAADEQDARSPPRRPRPTGSRASSTRSPSISATCSRPGCGWRPHQAAEARGRGRGVLDGLGWERDLPGVGHRHLLQATGTGSDGLKLRRHPGRPVRQRHHRQAPPARAPATPAGCGRPPGARPAPPGVPHRPVAQKGQDLAGKTFTDPRPGLTSSPAPTRRRGRPRPSRTCGGRSSSTTPSPPAPLTGSLVQRLWRVESGDEWDVHGRDQRQRPPAVHGLMVVGRRGIFQLAGLVVAGLGVLAGHRPGHHGGPADHHDHSTTLPPPTTTMATTTTTGSGVRAVSTTATRSTHREVHGGPPARPVAQPPHRRRLPDPHERRRNDLRGVPRPLEPVLRPRQPPAEQRRRHPPGRRETPPRLTGSRTPDGSNWAATAAGSYNASIISESPTRSRPRPRPRSG